MTTPFGHPRQWLAGSHPKCRPDGCPITNARHDGGGDGFPIFVISADGGDPSYALDCAEEHMNPVVQEDVTGCGIASVAALAGVTYQQAKAVATRLGLQIADSRLWSDTVFVRTLLKQYDIEAAPQEQPFRLWSTLPPLALLAIKWHRPGNQAFWHWVVFRRGTGGPVVIDPKRSLKQNVRTDFGRMKPKWFITIDSKRR